jgi:hypothetical protein
MSDSKSKAPVSRLDAELDDVDSIPIVKLSMDDFDPCNVLLIVSSLSPTRTNFCHNRMLVGKKAHKKSKKSKSKSKRAPSPPPPPPVYAEEDAPENAVPDSGDEDEKKAGKAKAKYTSYRGNRSSGVFGSEDASLHTVDLSLPVGLDEKLPQIQAYMSPEEVQRREQMRFKAERKAALESRAAEKVGNELMICLPSIHIRHLTLTVKEHKSQKSKSGEKVRKSKKSSSKSEGKKKKTSKKVCCLVKYAARTYHSY